MPLHECKCPKCFSQTSNLRGQVTCAPACDLAKCDLATGACSGGGGGGGAFLRPRFPLLLSWTLERPEPQVPVQLGHDQAVRAVSFPPTSVLASVSLWPTDPDRSPAEPSLNSMCRQQRDASMEHPAECAGGGRGGGRRWVRPVPVSSPVCHAPGALLLSQVMDHEQIAGF